MKKILLFLIATTILCSMSNVFVYADYKAEAAVQSYDFDSYESNDRVFDTLFGSKYVSGYSYVAKNTHKTAVNDTVNVYKLGTNSDNSHLRFVLDNSYEINTTTGVKRPLYEYDMQFYIEDISETGSFEISLIGHTSIFYQYFSGKLVITDSQIKWIPGAGTSYYHAEFSASLADAGIRVGEWVNLKLIGDIVTYNNTSRITIVVNDKIVPLTASSEVAIEDNSNGITYVAGKTYSVLPLKPAKNGRYVRSFEIAVKDTAKASEILVDTIKTAEGDGLATFKNIEDQILTIGEEKSINLNDYFFSYDYVDKNTTLQCSIDEKFGTIENGVLTFNTAAAISEAATLTAGTKEFNFNYTVKAAIDSVTIATADRVFSSNDGESITVDSVTYDRYAVITAKVPSVEGYELQEYGVLLLEGKAPYISSEGVLKGVADKAKTTVDGAYGVLFEGTGIRSGVKYYLRPYAIYVDALGNTTYKYGSSKTVTLND